MERKMDFWTIEISTKFKDKSMAERLQKALIDKFNYECNKNKDYMAQVAVGISNINSNYVNGVYNDRLKDGGRPRKVKDILDETNFSKMIYGKCEKDWHVHILALTSPSETLARIIKNYIDKNWNVGVSYKKFKYNGNKAYWEDKDEKFWKKMSNVFTNQVSDLEMLVPEFKIASAVIHYDESSPHLHIVGIPLKKKTNMVWNYKLVNLMYLLKILF